MPQGSTSRQTQRTARDPLDAVHAWATVAPALVLAWAGPGSLLGDVPTTASSGAAWAALLALPAGVLGAVRGRVRPWPLGLLALALVAAWVGSLRAVDAFEARRAVLGLSAALALAASGTSLGPAGRLVLARGLALAALVALVGAALDGRPGLGGALGNTGALAGLALPGALLGAALTSAPAGLRAMRWLGPAATLALALYAGLAPALTALVAWAVALACGAAAAVRRGGARGFVPTAAVGLALGAAAFGARTVLRASGDVPVARAAVDADLGGVDFRLRTWARAPRVLADFPFTGVGPGQFEREFPPYRDPAELLASSHGHREPTPVEVEHAHNDWIEGVLELGMLGGVPWLALLLVCAARALGALLDGDRVRAATGAAALAVLAAAAAGSTLLADPGAPVAAWVTLGAVLAPAMPDERRPGGLERPLGLALGALAALALALQVPRAWSIVQHGAALSQLAAARTVRPDGSEVLDAERARAPLERALAACPDSVVALEKRAEWSREAGAPVADRIAQNRRLLELRPHRFAALLNLGTDLAGSGALDDAEEPFARALALDPSHPALLRNRARLAAERGDGPALVERLDAARAAGALSREWLARTASDLLLAGLPALAQPLVWELEPERSVTNADQSYAWSKELQAGGATRLGDAALANAQLLFARGHVADGVPETAVRSYRQALRITRDYAGLPDGGAGVRLELAAAECLAGRLDDARETLREVPPTARAAGLPDWARAALRAVDWPAPVTGS